MLGRVLRRIGLTTMADLAEMSRHLAEIKAMLALSAPIAYSRTLCSVRSSIGQLYFYRFSHNQEFEGMVQEIISANEQNTGGPYDFSDIDFQDGDAVIDIGANIGVTAIYLAKKYPTIQVFAYEPIPQHCELIEANLRANGVSNVTLYPEAVTGDGRDVTLLFSPGGSLGACIVDKMREPHLAYVKNFPAATVERAKSVTLDGALERIGSGRCRMLKIDCEGAEGEVLESTPTESLKGIDNIRGELHLPREESNALHEFCLDLLGSNRVRFERHVASR